MNMHDWSLKSFTVDWESKHITFELLSHDGPKMIDAEDFISFKGTGNSPWGNSISINEIKGPEGTKDGHEILTIEIQSGDIIEIKAKKILMPKTDKTK